MPTREIVTTIREVKFSKEEFLMILRKWIDIPEGVTPQVYGTGQKPNEEYTVKWMTYEEEKCSGA